MGTQQTPKGADEIRDAVRQGYTEVVEGIGSSDSERVDRAARRIGYSDAELETLPEGANLGVGCGNPTAIDALRPGETVVDLGSGAGMDAFIAARQVGPTGRVIGVDMTDAMLDKARDNARKAGLESSVEFRKGTIESLPIDDASVDVIVSNCVINLSPEKDRVYAEAYRVLRPGGRIMISDIVLDRSLPAPILDSIVAYIGCVGGASLRADYLATVERAGFQDVRVLGAASFVDALDLDDPWVRETMERLGVSREQARSYADAITSLHLFARKPDGAVRSRA